VTVRYRGTDRAASCTYSVTPKGNGEILVQTQTTIHTDSTAKVKVYTLTLFCYGDVLTL
jgi:hypothetical protein